ncbi:MAG: hypothetical protein ITD31_03300 [Nitrosospira sp.]|jgi:hypothetical protein|nr:hypothetical protein [Nitrosospira sp.]
MSAIILTEDQRKQVLHEFDVQIEMLSAEEVEVLASKLNKKIDLPFITEGTEQIIFVKTVKVFDRLLYQNIPNELYGLIKNTSDGISDKDAEELKLVLGSRLNKSLEIPYVPEWVEQQVFEILIGLVVDAMKKGCSLLK